MSYINFSLTRHASTPIDASSSLRAGFSREGGKLEFVERASSSHGPLPPLTSEVELTISVH